MAIVPLSTDLNHIQALDDRPNANSGMTADQVKEAFDQSGNDIKEYINDSLIPNINSTFVSNTSLATDRKLSGTGDFTGTINGLPIIMSNPGLATEFSAFQADVVQRDINVMYPPSPLVAAVGDGTTDDTVALQAIFDYAVLHGLSVIAVGTFKITAKLVIKGHFDGINATLAVYGTPAVAVEISTGNASDPTTDLFNNVVSIGNIVNMTKPGTGWGSQGVGLRTVNNNGCAINILNIKNFMVGLLLTSFGGTGNVYNNVYIQTLENNQINFKMQPGDVSSWVNENNIYGGRYQQYSNEGVGVSGTRHIQIKMFSSLGTVPNNNVFYKPSIEGSVCEYNLESEGTSNYIMFGRWESTIPKILYNSITSSSGHDNVIFYGYKSESIVYTLTGVSTLGNHHYGNHVGAKTSSNQPAMMVNYTSSANPIIMLFASGTAILNKDDTATDFTGRIGANTWSGKKDTDTNDRWRLDSQNGRLYLNNGTATPTGYIGAYGTELAVRGKTFNLPDMTYLQPLGLGASGTLWLDTVNNLRLKASSPSSDTDGFPLMQMRSGVTGSRPTTGLYVGYPYFDTTLGYLINVKTVAGPVWVNGAGTTV